MLTFLKFQNIYGNKFYSKLYYNNLSGLYKKKKINNFFLLVFRLSRFFFFLRTLICTIVREKNKLRFLVLGLDKLFLVDFSLLATGKLKTTAVEIKNISQSKKLLNTDTDFILFFGNVQSETAVYLKNFFKKQIPLLGICSANDNYSKYTYSVPLNISVQNSYFFFFFILRYIKNILFWTNNTLSNTRGKKIKMDPVENYYPYKKIKKQIFDAVDPVVIAYKKHLLMLQRKREAAKVPKFLRKKKVFFLLFSRYTKHFLLKMKNLRKLFFLSFLTTVRAQYNSKKLLKKFLIRRDYLEKKNKLFKYYTIFYRFSIRYCMRRKTLPTIMLRILRKYQRRVPEIRILRQQLPIFKKTIRKRLWLRYMLQKKTKRFFLAKRRKALNKFAFTMLARKKTKNLRKKKYRLMLRNKRKNIFSFYIKNYTRNFLKKSIKSHVYGIKLKKILSKKFQKKKSILTVKKITKRKKKKILALSSSIFNPNKKKQPLKNKLNVARLLKRKKFILSYRKKVMLAIYLKKKFLFNRLLSNPSVLNKIFLRSLLLKKKLPLKEKISLYLNNQKFMVSKKILLKYINKSKRKKKSKI